MNISGLIRAELYRYKHPYTRKCCPALSLKTINELLIEIYVPLVLEAFDMYTGAFNEFDKMMNCKKGSGKGYRYELKYK